MQALLAMLAAIAWGSGNFTMGIAGRRSSPRTTVLIGFGTGFIGAIVFFLFQQPDLSASSFGWGVVAGVCQGTGWLCFSRALYLGRMSLVAPLTAATTTTSLYMVGLLYGDPLEGLSIVGVMCAIVAIVLLTQHTQDVDNLPKSGPRGDESAGIVFSLAAGLVFMLQFLALRKAGTHSSSLVIMGAGFGVVVLSLTTLIRHPIPKSDFVKGGPFAALGGGIIFLGDISYLYALHLGPLTVAALSGINPAFTVLLAQLILRERIRKDQAAGIVLAILGATLIAIN